MKVESIVLGSIGTNCYIVINEETKECSAKLGVRTVALCAYKLSFIHPVSGETLSFETKPETKGFSFFPLS